MAINVYLTVNRKYSAAQLRRLELPYVIVSYLVPFLVGFTFIFIKTADKGPVYGDAVLWCWISSKWDILRIATFYGPVWVIIACTFLLYVSTGRVIFKLRTTLRQFAAKNGRMTNTTDAGVSQALPSPTAIKMTTVTQVEVSSPISSGILPPHARRNDYTCNVTAETPDDNKEDFELEPEPETQLRAPQIDLEKIGSINSDAAKRAAARAKSNMRANAAALAYARCAMLFFVGLIITWLPSSMNRVYSYTHKNKSDFNLSFLSGLVLPAQGFWNVIIYVCTSWKSCVSLWEDIVSKLRIRPRSEANIQKLSPVSSTFDRDFR